MGSGAGRAANDRFMAAALPLLDSSESIFRYAWYSARNVPSSWVNESYLLPPVVRDAPGTDPAWTKTSTTACKGDQMLYLSQHGSLHECQAATEGNGGCVGAPTKVAIYETGDANNCCVLAAS